MTLLALLSGVETVEVSGDTSMEISDIIYDSRKVVPDSVYVALAGVRSDGHDYLIDAVRGGAVAVVVENREKAESLLLTQEKLPQVTVVYVEETRRALALLFLYHQVKILVQQIGNWRGIVGGNVFCPDQGFNSPDKPRLYARMCQHGVYHVSCCCLSLGSGNPDCFKFLLRMVKIVGGKKSECPAVPVF